MIFGHGIDLQEIDKLEVAIGKHPQLVAKILTPAELDIYQSYPSRRALIYLAGRWSAKEAFSKAYGTGLKTDLDFQDLEILADRKGRPIFTQSPFAGKVWVSISHSGNFAQASVILEEVNHDS